MKEIDELARAAQRIVINSNSGMNCQADREDYLKKEAELIAIYENLHKILGQKRKTIQELKKAKQICAHHTDEECRSFFFQCPVCNTAQDKHRIKELEAENKKLAEKAWRYDELCK